MSLEPVQWEDYPSTATPITAATMNAQQAYVAAQATAAEVAQAGAEAAAAAAQAPTDTMVATLLAAETSDTRVVADGLYQRTYGARGVTRTIYVRADGDDATGDGATPGTALREIRTAIDLLTDDGPLVRGSVLVDVGAGTYKGGIKLPPARGYASDDFIKIVGPDVGGSPNVPTAIVDEAADTAATYGVQATDGAFLWVQNMKFVGSFGYAIDVRRNVYAYLSNVHGVGAGAGTVFFGALTHVRYAVLGGIVDGYENGFQEHFGCVRSFDGATSAATGTTVTGCDVGLQAKENCVGHVDWTTFTDCGTGLELQAYSAANIKGTTWLRDDVGIALLNSEIHNETTGVTWGTGADACGRRIYSAGASSELALPGWTGSPAAASLTTGHRPLVQLAASYADVTITGTTSSTVAFTFATVLRAGWYAVAGKHYKVRVVGSVDTPPTGGSGIRLLLYVAGTLMVEVPIPTTALAGQDFVAEWDVVCTADGAHQKAIATITGFPPGTSAYQARTIDMSTDRTVEVRVIPNATADSVTLRLCEVYG